MVTYTQSSSRVTWMIILALQTVYIELLHSLYQHVLYDVSAHCAQTFHTFTAAQLGIFVWEGSKTYHILFIITQTVNHLIGEGTHSSDLWKCHRLLWLWPVVCGPDPPDQPCLCTFSCIYGCYWH